MNTLEQPTIEEEITFIDRGIRHQRELIRSHGPDSKRTPVYKAKIEYLREKQKVLQSLLEEQAAGWEIVFLQPQNDHDEVWKCASPGPHIAKLMPESHKLGNLIVHLNQSKYIHSNLAFGMDRFHDSGECTNRPCLGHKF